MRNPRVGHVVCGQLTQSVQHMVVDSVIHNAADGFTGLRRLALEAVTRTYKKKLVHHWINRSRPYTVGVFIDKISIRYSKTFSINRRNPFSIKKKINKYCIRCISANCIKNYLCGRKHFVNIGECSSDLIQISCGVPQDSVLEPKLFIFI